MAQIPYVPADLADPAAIVDAVRARRGGHLLNLDRMLLHSPPMTAGWNTFLGALRGSLALSPRLRELAICAVGHLNGAPYEVLQHTAPFLEAGGTRVQLATLSEGVSAAATSDRFDPAERAVLSLAIEMTREIRVTPQTMAAARAHLGNDRLLVELVGVIAAYNMVSRFLVALGVEPEDDLG